MNEDRIVMTLLWFPLLAVLSASDSIPRTLSVPDSVTATSQGVSVIVHRQPATPLVALRMAILANDPAGYAGAGHLVQHVLQPILRDRLAVVGGQVQLQRTSDAVVFTVVGPAAELSYLSETLRTALRPPQVSEAALLRASRELAEERLAEWETADRHVRSALRGRLFPNDLSAAGTESAANRLMEENALHTAWTELYRPDRVTITAVGDIALEQVETAFAGLPPARPRRSAEPLRDTLDLAPLAVAEATQGWFGLGYSGASVDPVVLSVATRVVGTELRDRAPAAVVEAEHWWTSHGQAMVLVASAPSGDLQQLQQAIGTALASAQSGLTAAKVSEAARAIRREMLFYARTPDRMADVLGQFSDRGGDADAAQKFYAGLERVSEREVQRALAALMERTPIRVEIPPQKLNRP